MTLSTTTPRIQYTGTGAVTTYAYPFKIVAGADLSVVTRDADSLVETTLTLGTDYTVTGAGAAAGGTVVLTTALPAGDALVIRRVVALSQTTDVRNQSSGFPAAMERALDYGTMIDQQQQVDIDRSVKLPATLTPGTIDTNLPLPFVAGQVLAVNGAGTGLTLANVASLAPSSEVLALPGSGRVTDALTTYLAHNAVVNVLDYGTGVGQGDALVDLAALDAAILSLAPEGGTVKIPAGTVLTLNAAPTVPVVALRLVSDGGLSSGFAMTNESKARIYCNGMTGYLFDFPANPTLRALSLVGLEFDGSNGGYSAATASTTWLGVVDTSGVTTPSANVDALEVTHCDVRWSYAAGSYAFNLINCFHAAFTGNRVSYFTQGGALKLGGNASVSTTMRFYHNYWHYCRELVTGQTNMTHALFVGDVFESSLVAAALIGGRATFVGCHFENIGYSVEATVTDAVSYQGMGIAFGAPLQATKVDTAFNFVYGSYHFIDCEFGFLAVAGGAIATAYFRLVGMGSGAGEGGHLCIESSNNGEATLPAFAYDLTSIHRAGFSVEVRDGYAAGRFFLRLYADARRVNQGHTRVTFASGFRLAHIRRGRFIYGYGAEYGVGNEVYAATGLADAPTGGQNEVGDEVIVSAPASGGSKGAVCTTAGSPGTWKAWGAIA
jgi:hypothetical protein